jgi:DNA modification methylase
MTTTIHQGDALNLPIPDNTVDLVVTSPPYFGLRSYQDGGQHYDGQIGDEATPAEFVAALIAATAEMVRVVKPSGSIWVNLGDKYNARKSLIGIPWRYALACIDELGLILRAEVIWNKPNGLPESVTDRVRRSHETWFHFTLNPRYYANVDEIREPHMAVSLARAGRARDTPLDVPGQTAQRRAETTPNPLGKLPGSVWTIATQPLTVPDHLGIDHFAAFPMEWPRRIIKGWSPPGICTACGVGRSAVVNREFSGDYNASEAEKQQERSSPFLPGTDQRIRGRVGDTAKVTLGKTDAVTRTITGYACDCAEPTAPTRPAVVLDPFGGTGTVALIADTLGRDAIHIDLSADYCRLAHWRTTDPAQRAAALQVDKPPTQTDGQLTLEETPQNHHNQPQGANNP